MATVDINAVAAYTSDRMAFDCSFLSQRRLHFQFICKLVYLHKLL